MSLIYPRIIIMDKITLQNRIFLSRELGATIFTVSVPENFPTWSPRWKPQNDPLGLEVRLICIPFSFSSKPPKVDI